MEDSYYRNTYVFACTNYGFLDYTLNFIEFYKKLKTKWKLHISCMDSKSYDILKQIPEIVAVYLEMPGFENFSEWTQLEHKIICYYRYKIIHPLLKEKRINYVIHFDTDIAILKDPVDYMIDYMEKTNCDIAGQCDEEYKCQNPLNCQNVCCGCFIIRRCDRTIDACSENFYFHHIENFKKGIYSPNDQIYLNSQLRIKHCLPPHLFMHTPKHNLLNDNTFTYHFNYLVGNSKKSRMKDTGFWILDT